MKNLILDTNIFLALFESEQSKNWTIPAKNINLNFLKSICSKNDTYVTSAVLFEVLLQCIERSDSEWEKQINEYIMFINKYFKNKYKVINEKSHLYFDFDKFKNIKKENILNFFEEKIKFEVQHLHIFISAIVISIESIFLELFDRKVNEKHYESFVKDVNIDLIAELTKTAKDRYSLLIDNKDYDKKINSLLYEILHKVLEYLSKNYVITEKEINYVFNNHILSSLQSTDFMNIYNIIKNLKIEGKDGEEAAFFKYDESPDYINYIKPLAKTQSDGVEYIKQILVNIEKKKQKNYREIAKNGTNTIFTHEKFKNYSQVSKKYLNHIASSCITKHSRIRKNDTSDYLIVSAFDYKNQCPSINRNYDNIVLTNDGTMKSFICENQLFYDQDIYTNLFQ